jgi:hypothetical protein
MHTSNPGRANVVHPSKEHIFLYWYLFPSNFFFTFVPSSSSVVSLFLFPLAGPFRPPPLAAPAAALEVVEEEVSAVLRRVVLAMVKKIF